MTGFVRVRRLVSLLALSSGGLFAANAAWPGPKDGSPCPVCRALTRSFRTVGTVVVVSADYKFLSWRFRGNYDSSNYREERSKVHSRSAERMVQLCNKQGGLYLKMGQHVASLSHAVPVEYTSLLASLQDQCTFDPILAVEQVWTEEFGTKLSEVFESFDPIPVASASLAQVHRAELRETGEVVAVKVQHPALTVNVPVDLASVRLLLRMVSYAFPDFDLQWIAPEFERNIIQELNFRREAANAEKASGSLVECRQIHVPRVHREWTSTRVLTMEFISGCRITDINTLEKWRIDLREVSDAVTRAFANMTFVSGFVHCDPHPGNILIQPVDLASHPLTVDCDPSSVASFRVVLIDHGLYRQLEPTERIAFCRLWKGLIMRDMGVVHQASQELGVPERGDLFSVFLLSRSLSRIAKPETDLNAQLTREDFKGTARELKSQGVTKADVLAFVRDIPRDLLLVFKILSLIRNICEDLGSATDRYILGARYAIRGIYFGSSETKDAWESNWALAPGARPRSPAERSWSIQYAWDRVNLELRLFLLLLYRSIMRYRQEPSRLAA